ncbi:uncharacterized protein FTOL_09622 [Fusarium torulosum]|uniref:Uncharacterized protein n=1 Tax=Fusarium torulosum TaxID=33205 RepID=A0AAE8MGI0_9HYPO|nr:uncharacterized protein FTOL_09622 [Fusarium torulosum]
MSRIPRAKRSFKWEWTGMIKVSTPPTDPSSLVRHLAFFRTPKNLVNRGKRKRQGAMATCLVSMKLCDAGDGSRECLADTGNVLCLSFSGIAICFGLETFLSMASKSEAEREPLKLISGPVLVEHLINVEA